jgi:pimeloyl-[acyl-carrier protein] synthase
VSVEQSGASSDVAQRVATWLTGVGPEARALRDEPHALFDELRATDPVHHSVTGAWILTRYPDVKKFLRATATIQAPAETLGEGADHADSEHAGPFLRLMSNFLIHMDPPNHTRLRRQVQKAFTNANIDRWAQPVSSIVADLYREIEPQGQMELLHDFAEKVPLRTINTLLGLPPETTGDQIGAIGSATRQNNYPGVRGADFYADADKATAEYSDWLGGIIQSRRNNLGDDLLSTLIAEDAEHTLTDEEVIALVTILHLAGYATTFSLIGSAMVLFLRNPDQLEAVRNDESLLPAAIEEILRYQPSGTTLRPRVTLEDMTFNGVTIPAGSRVYALSQFANRDPEVFVDPHRFDIRRTPNDHLSFGFGIHYCVGNFLARLETKAALSSLIRLRDLQLEIEPVWQDSVTTRSYDSLPVSWTVSDTADALAVSSS